MQYLKHKNKQMKRNNKRHATTQRPGNKKLCCAHLHERPPKAQHTQQNKQIRCKKSNCMKWQNLDKFSINFEHLRRIFDNVSIKFDHLRPISNRFLQSSRSIRPICGQLRIILIIFVVFDYFRVISDPPPIRADALPP